MVLMKSSINQQVTSRYGFFDDSQQWREEEHIKEQH